MKRDPSDLTRPGAGGGVGACAHGGPRRCAATLTSPEAAAGTAIRARRSEFLRSPQSTVEGGKIAHIEGVVRNDCTSGRQVTAERTFSIEPLGDGADDSLRRTVAVKVRRPAASDPEEPRPRNGLQRTVGDGDRRTLGVIQERQRRTVRAAVVKTSGGAQGRGDGDQGRGGAVESASPHEELSRLRRSRRRRRARRGVATFHLRSIDGGARRARSGRARATSTRFARRSRSSA